MVRLTGGQTRDETAATLEEIERLLEKLNESGLPVLVEGEKDEQALRALGVRNPVVRAGSAGVTLFVLAETISREHPEIVILTDWDRAGGRTARILREALTANGVRADGEYRRALSRLTRHQIGDVESLATHVDNLRRRLVS